MARRLKHFRRESRTVFISFVLAVAAVPFAAQGQPNGNLEREPDDALPRDRRKLVAELTDRDMPELVEELLADAPLMHHVYIARAYAKAAGESKDSETRRRFLEKSATEYQRIVKLADDADWLRGLRRKFDVVQWQVEWADLLLRQFAAPELDRYEATSGLDFDRARLFGWLRDSHRLYVDAGRRCDELLVGLRTQEQRFLLLGLADKITGLADLRRLNAAWADVYLAMVESNSSMRPALLDSALADFDAVSRSAKDPERKYNALVGAGVALREIGRYPEAVAALDRVRLSTASPALIVRARYEEARAHLTARHYDEARRELTELGGLPSAGPDDPAAFYVRLAPVMAAYADLLESSNLPAGSRQSALRERAIVAFTDIAKQGGPWPSIAQVYLDKLQAPHRRLNELSDAELSMDAARLMKDGKFERAAEPLRILLARPAAKDRLQNQFNFAVCQFQTGDLDAAAGGFESIAKNAATGDLAERAALYAYDCRRKIASTEKNSTRYKQLADAAACLADRFGANARADEARWVAALSYQEAGQLNLAIAVYERVPAASPYRAASTRGIAICRQRLYNELPPDASRDRRQKAARTAVDAWKTVAHVYEQTKNPSTTVPDQTDVIEEARLAAASLLAGPDLAAFDEAWALLRTLPRDDRSVLLRLQCLRGLGDEKNARRGFDELLKETTDSQRGRVLSVLALQVRDQAVQLEKIGRRDEARKCWREAADVLRELLEWLGRQTDAKAPTAAARADLAGALAGSGDSDAALAEYDQLIADDPTNGGYLCDAARLCEELIRHKEPPDSAAADRAESYWARLLKDARLRERSPAVYWEARYCWLSHQLRHGRAADVWKGIESEKAWYPDLGGPPWQSRLIELAQKARETDGQGSR